MSGASGDPKVTERIGRYEVVGELAVGGMATILLGRLVGPRGFERPVVIKRILPHLARVTEFVDMFVDEARIVAGIRHPNVVQVQELGREGDELFLVMEYLEGESVGGLLRRVVSRGERIDYALAMHIVAEASAGLHAAHDLTDEAGKPRGLVHRDVSPQNVMVTYAGEVKVLDFGVAKAADRHTKTEAGQLKGKFEYMSPEQCASKPLDRRSDVFALGILLYELSTGRRLFRRDGELATLKAICEEPVPSPAGVSTDYPPQLAAICLRALARRPADRHATAAELRRDLLSAQRELGTEVVPEESLAHLMRQLFAERIEEKREMLRRVRTGDATHVPAAETDGSVDIPVVTVEEGSVLRSTTDVTGPSLEPRRPMRLGVPLAIGAVALAVLGVAWMRRTGAGADGAALPVAAPEPTISAPVVTPTATAPTVVPTDEAAQVLLHVETTPPGARVLVDGDERGVTPADVRLSRGSTAVRLELRRDGFATLVQSVVPDVDQRLVLTLSAAGRGGRPPAKARGPAPTASDDGYHRFQ